MEAKPKLIEDLKKGMNPQIDTLIKSKVVGLHEN